MYIKYITIKHVYILFCIIHLKKEPTKGQSPNKIKWLSVRQWKKNDGGDRYRI